MSLFQRFERNTQGRDLVVGDIHGNFTRLRESLDAVGFNPATDRLFSVGDLIDRGPECESVVDWLQEPWFFPVCGNHDNFAVRWKTVDRENWLLNGGAWFMGLPEAQQAEIAAALTELPLAIEVETLQGPVGIVHADLPTDWTWPQTIEALSRSAPVNRLRRDIGAYLMWSRTRIEFREDSGVRGCRALIVGHTPLREVTALGNVIYIDTGGWRVTGSFTLLDLATLTPAGASERGE